MKNCYFFICGIVTLFCVSCVKDLGNYNYKIVNEAIIEGIDSIYEVENNGVLKINPKLTFSNDPNYDESNYEYGWYRIGHIGVSSTKPDLISDSLNFDQAIVANWGLGVYDYSFRVTDKRTGVWSEKVFKILISNDIYEGWYVLSEVENQNSRLDFLSYKAARDEFDLMNDILKLKKSTLTLEGLPLFVEVMDYSVLAIATSKISRMISANNFTGFPVPNFNNFESNNYEAIGTDSRFYVYNAQRYLTNNGKVFTQSSNTKYVQKNFMEQEPSKSFKASPYLSFYNFTDALIFNTDISEFVNSRGNSANKYSLKINNERLHSLTRGKELLFTKFNKQNNGETLAIMKDKQNNNLSLVRIDKNITNPRVVEISGSLIAQAELFEFSDYFSYIFYSVGGKLYQYNYGTKVNTLMADYGSRKISMLKVPNLSFVGVTKTPRKEDYMKRLFVGTYENGNFNNSGVLDEYAVPPRSEPLTKVNSFSGLGKIKDITYRNR